MKKIPVDGKVVAKHFDVAWLASLDQQVKTLAGKVSAKAKVAGTVGDPQLTGDVHWENGKMVVLGPRGIRCATLGQAPARQPESIVDPQRAAVAAKRWR